jgi:hypothetical protein
MIKAVIMNKVHNRNIAAADFIFSPPSGTNLFYGSPVGSRFFQCIFHFFDSNFRGIVINGVDLLGVIKPFVNPLYPFQPFQGCFAYIVSPNVENHSRWFRILSQRRVITVNQRQYDKEKYHQE